MNNLTAECNRRVRIRVNGADYQVTQGTVLGDFVAGMAANFSERTVAAVINNLPRSYHYRLTEPVDIELLGAYSREGLRTVRRTAEFILTKVAAELFPEHKLILQHNTPNGLYAEFADKVINAAEVDRISRSMDMLIKDDIKINLQPTNLAAAVNIFRNQRQEEKIELLGYHGEELVSLFELAGYYEYGLDLIGYSSGIVSEFKLLPYSDGLLLQLPNKTRCIPPYTEQKKLFQAYQDGEKWGKTLGVSTVADLNRMTKNGGLNHLILVNEALQEKQVMRIADQICADPRVRVILISGPSSSGKTTFAKKLDIQLRANGKKPLAISLDDYFVNRQETPRDERGEWDFEAFEAIDYRLFNEHLVSLLAGQEVIAPRFDFLTGVSHKGAVLMRVATGEPIIIEGIHALNKDLTAAIPAAQKFKIFVSAITHLNLDTDKPISTTDSRLLRRIVRDYRTRGDNALNTIKRWPSVRRGEETNIFPHQEQADVFFNSYLTYELAVIKVLAMPLLRDIPVGAAERQDALRLIELLSYVRGAFPNEIRIPFNSLLREFVG